MYGFNRFSEGYVYTEGKLNIFSGEGKYLRFYSKQDDGVSIRTASGYDGTKSGSIYFNTGVNSGTGGSGYINLEIPDIDNGTTRSAGDIVVIGYWMTININDGQAGSVYFSGGDVDNLSSNGDAGSVYIKAGYSLSSSLPGSIYMQLGSDDNQSSYQINDYSSNNIVIADASNAIGLYGVSPTQKFNSPGTTSGVTIGSSDNLKVDTTFT